MKSFFFIFFTIIGTTLLISNANSQCINCSGDLSHGRPLQVSSNCTTEYCSFDDGNITLCTNSTNIAAINDNNVDTSWISSTGPDLVLPVTIQLNLESAMTFYDLSIIWSSPTPSGMILERSTDYGITWSPYRYWSIDCNNEFGLPTIADPLSLSSLSLDPICTDYQLDTLTSGAQV